MTTALAVRSEPSQTLPAKIQYARALAESGLLPTAYRGNPGNVLYAVEYGDMLGLPPMAAITGIHVIEGKPSASASLISALVRRAGHKLRITGDARAASCQIVRCDDPDYTFEVTFTIDDAKTAGLTGKDVWKKYTASMLKARAISQCARDACEEALYGLHYTPEEMGAEVDGEGEIVDETPRPAPQQAASIAPEDLWQTPAPGTDEKWLAETLEKAASFATDDDGRKLWDEANAKGKAHEVSRADVEMVKANIRKRWAELKAAAEETVEGTIVPDLDPADEWALKIGDLTTLEEVGDTIAEVAAAREAGMDEDRAAAIEMALTAKAEEISQGAAA